MKTMKTLIAATIALGLLDGAVATAQVPALGAHSFIAKDNPHIQVRRDLRALKGQLQKGKCHVAFLGGSITQNGGGHVAMVPEWLKKTFPKAEVKVTNVGLSSTCSTSGAFRLESHIFGKEKVDLLVVEFAVNDDQDAAHAHREATRGMEGIVRKVLRDHPECALVMVHYVNPGILKKLQDGEKSVSVAAHEAVAERYGVISVNVAAEIADATKTGRYSWKDYGGTHPKKFGYRVASNMIIQALERGMAMEQKPKADLPKPVDAGSYDGGMFVAPSEAKRGKGWLLGKANRELLPLGVIRSQYHTYDLLRGNEPGLELTLPFEGRAVGAFVLAGPDAGIVETKIDDGEWTKQDLFHRFSGGLNYPRSVIFAAELRPGKHVLALRLAKEKNAKSKGTSASILFFEVNR